MPRTKNTRITEELEEFAEYLERISEGGDPNEDIPRVSWAIAKQLRRIANGEPVDQDELARGFTGDDAEDFQFPSPPNTRNRFGVPNSELVPVFVKAYEIMDGDLILYDGTEWVRIDVVNQYKEGELVFMSNGVLSVWQFDARVHVLYPREG